MHNVNIGHAGQGPQGGLHLGDVDALLHRVHRQIDQIRSRLGADHDHRHDPKAADRVNPVPASQDNQQTRQSDPHGAPASASMCM